MNTYSRITHASVHPAHRTPERLEIEQRLRRRIPSLALPPGLMRRAFGLREHALADPADLPSDLAARSASRLLNTARLRPADIDLLLFAAVSADVREPANAHIFVDAFRARTGPSFAVPGGRGADLVSSGGRGAVEWGYRRGVEQLGSSLGS